MTGAEEILRAHADGSGLESVVTFAPVFLVEAIYYPDVQWVGDGGRAFTAVSGPVEAAAPASIEASLWRIPATGAAEEIGTVATSVVANPPRWSNDGSKIAYIRRSFESTRDELIIAEANGDHSVAYLDGEQFRFLSWSPNNEDFVFGSPEFYAVGRLGASSTRFPLTAGQVAFQAEWLNDSAFVVAINATSSSVLTSNNAAGQSTVVANLGRLTAPFDVWTP
jgi:hypothetical protein